MPSDIGDRPFTPAAYSGFNDTDVLAVVLFTHLFDPSVAKRYLKLKDELGKLARIFILAARGTSIPPEYADETYFFDYDRLRSGAARVIGDKIIPGNVHLVQLDFYRHHPGFDYYWFIEYDVVFTGNWVTLLDAVKSDHADLLAAHTRSRAEEPGWPWWETLDLPGCALQPADWLRAFFPIYRISGRGFRAVDEHVKSGWTGHFEGLIPSVLRSAGLSISDFGGSGAWTPKERRHRFYSSVSFDSGRSLNAGTHRHKPSHLFPLLRRNTIFHPLKSGPSGEESGVIQFVRHYRLHELHLRSVASIRQNSLSLWRTLCRMFDRKSQH